MAASCALLSATVARGQEAKMAAADSPLLQDWAVDSALAYYQHEASDSRLGAFSALTYGLKFAQKLPGLGGRAESEFSVRAEYYQQTFNERIATPAALQGLDLFPGLKAILVQVGWRF